MRLKVVFAASEAAPFSKTGGLADVIGSLPQALAHLGAEVRILTPMYRSVLEGGFRFVSPRKALQVPFRGGMMPASVYSRRAQAGVSYHFIRRDEFFDRTYLYGTPDGDYLDNAERFIFFNRAVLAWCRKFDFTPHIIHCHDWQTGLIPAYLRSSAGEGKGWRRTKSVFTIHNLAYQGRYSSETLEASGLPGEFFTPEGLEFYGGMNFMKSGIVFSDAVTTVSRRYAREILSPEYGHGLDGVLKKRKKDIWGILNGVDYRVWNPETDAYISARYSRNDLSGKAVCKQDLKALFSLQGPENAPIIGMITRLAAQKGLDLVLEAVNRIISWGAMLVILGKGDRAFERQVLQIAKKHRPRVAAKIAFDEVLAHKIEAGADMFLMPSRYEPCGLNQMYSLKYGTIPIVRATGGLDDTVKEFDSEKLTGNGFKFVDDSAAALLKAVRTALRVYRDPKAWAKLMKNAMRADFSWEKTAGKVYNLYQRLLG